MRAPGHDAHQAILRLLRRHGWNATAYQIVNPGFSHWFSVESEAVVGYVTKAGHRIVAGAPVCPLENLPDVVVEWERACDEADEKCVYFGAAGRLSDILEERAGYSRVVLGAQPVWEPGGWGAKFETKASLRAQLNRARNKGLVVTEWPMSRATLDPQLTVVLREWLASRGLPPLHFLVEPETLNFLDDKRVFVAVLHGTPVAFLTMAPVPARNGWLTEQFVRGRNAPNGTIESLVDTAVRKLAGEGAQYVTMGLVPLSTIVPAWWNENPAWLQGAGMWARAHMRRFYNFAGLEAFKTKFLPDSWEPIYAFSCESRFSAQSLYAIVAAFTDIPPVLALASGLARATRQALQRDNGKSLPSTTNFSTGQGAQ